jgi:ATP-dependent RNA helicase DeaD
MSTSDLLSADVSPDVFLDFSAFPPVIVQALAAQGIETPTLIQKEAIGPILEGQDILAQSQTGSGKTLAFALPIGLLLEHPSHAGLPRALILAPTRELANQVESVFSTTLACLGLRCLSIIGGGSYGKQKYALREGVDIVVGTPGRVVDLMRQGSLVLDDTALFVLDEVDQMLDIGFADELNAVKEGLPDDVQTLFFSATMSKDMEAFAHSLLREPIRLKMAQQSHSPDTIEHRCIPVKHNGEVDALINTLLHEHPEQALIFCPTRQSCRDISEALQLRGFQASPISGELGQDVRQATMDRFREGRLQYLVATNVAARGLDIQSLPLVINMDVPFDVESYTHRIGRTGRAGEKGQAWTFVTHKNFRRYKAFLQKLQVEVSLYPVPSRHEVLAKAGEREIMALVAQTENSTPRPIRRVAESLLVDLSDEERDVLLRGLLLRKLTSMQVHDARACGIEPEEFLQREDAQRRRGRQQRRNVRGPRGKQGGESGGRNRRRPGQRSTSGKGDQRAAGRPPKRRKKGSKQRSSSRNSS